MVKQGMQKSGKLTVSIVFAFFLLLKCTVSAEERQGRIQIQIQNSKSKIDQKLATIVAQSWN